MKQYESYTPSGIEWIGDIPEHWTKKQLKYFCKICNGKEFSDWVVEDGGYPVYGTGGEFARSSKYLYDSISVLLGRKGTIDKPQIVNRCFWTSDTVYYTRIFDDVIPKYLFHLVNQISFDLYAYGSAIPSMTKTEYDDMVFPYPPLPEQQQIVTYLDDKIAIINDLIQKKQRKIELLKEQRTSIINQAVTKGLDANVKMKDSGVEWIGEIPEGWDSVRLKYLCDFITEKGETIETDIKISPENVESLTGVCFNKYSEYLGEGIRFMKGDILFNKLRVYLVKILLADYDGFSMGEMIVLRPNNIFNRYLYYVLFNQRLINLLNSQSTGVKLPRVSPEIILNSFIPNPPHSNQQQIVDYLDEKTSSIDNQIALENQKIDLLKEYRQSLISEVVTGKIDVRIN